MVKSRYIGDGHPAFNRNPYNGYKNPYYWVDDHPLLYGNNGSLDPGTYVYIYTYNIHICISCRIICSTRGPARLHTLTELALASCIGRPGGAQGCNFEALQETSLETIRPHGGQSSNIFAWPATWLQMPFQGVISIKGSFQKFSDPCLSQ